MREHIYRVVYWIGSCVTERYIAAFSEAGAKDKMKEFNIVNIERMN